MKKINLFVHIGASKTGSSAIQGVLHKNHFLLKELGYLYPNLGGNLNEAPNFNHSSYIGKHNNKEKQEALNNCIEFCKQKVIPNIIISNEVVIYDRWEWLNPFKNRTDINLKIIFYLRRQDHWLESSWKQWGIKSDCKDLDDFLQNHNNGMKFCNWYQYYKLWKKIYGKAPLIVKPYEKQQLLNQNVIDDFFNSIGVTDFEKLILPDKDSYKSNNPGFSRDILEIIRLCRYMANHIHDNSLFIFFSKYLGAKHQKQPFSKYNFFSPQKRLEILEQFKNSNRELSESVLGKGESFFKETIPDAGEPFIPYEGLTIEKIVPIFIEILFKFEKDNNILSILKQIKNIEQQKANQQKKLNNQAKIIKELVDKVEKLEEVTSNQRKSLQNLRARIGKKAK